MDAALRFAVEPPEAAADAWLRLWRRVAGASPFQSPAWLLAWARSYAPGRCRVATATCAGEVVAALPFFWWERTLFLAGTGPSDHGDGLFPPGFESCAGPLLAAALTAAGGPMERIDLQQLPASSPLLVCEAPPGWRGEVVAGDACAVLALAGDDGMDHVGRRLRSNSRQATRGFVRRGGTVELVAGGEIADAVTELEHLHAVRWSRRGEAGVLADPLLDRLVRDAAPALARDGLLRLHRLRIADATIAALLALRGDRSTCFYLSGFDPAFAKLSPGTVLVGATIAAAARDGDLHADFLRGREPYKTHWGVHDVPRLRRVFLRAQ